MLYGDMDLGDEPGLFYRILGALLCCLLASCMLKRSWRASQGVCTTMKTGVAELLGACR